MRATSLARRRLAAAVIAVVLLAGTGCASQPQTAGTTVSDPLEPVNRAVFAFNDTLDRFALRPVAVGYTKGLPQQIRQGVHNVLSNLLYPVVIVNNFLQGKLKDGGKDTARLIINTIVGLGGIFDPASEIGLAEHDEDFGQTLAVWGVPSGPYLVLPLLGPSTFRDATGTVADLPLTPYLNAGDWEVRWGMVAIWAIDRRSGLLDVDEQVRQAFDPYVFVRDAYIQNRRYRIGDGNVPAMDSEIYPDEEEQPDDDKGKKTPADGTDPAPE